MYRMDFQASGSSHSLRILPRGDLNVWEALVDGVEYFYFEAPEESEVWELLTLALSQYLGYRAERGTERKEWRAP